MTAESCHVIALILFIAKYVLATERYTSTLLVSVFPSEFGCRDILPSNTDARVLGPMPSGPNAHRPSVYGPTFCLGLWSVRLRA